VSGGVTTRFSAKAAIVTVPLGVLKKRGPAFFSPALSGTKLDAVNRLGMGLLNKVILEVSEGGREGGVLPPFSLPWCGALRMHTACRCM
jgi:hypothetical protein